MNTPGGVILFGHCSLSFTRVVFWYVAKWAFSSFYLKKTVFSVKLRSIELVVLNELDCQGPSSSSTIKRESLASIDLSRRTLSLISKSPNLKRANHLWQAQTSRELSSITKQIELVACFAFFLRVKLVKHAISKLKFIERNFKWIQKLLIFDPMRLCVGYYHAWTHEIWRTRIQCLDIDVFFL